MTKIFLKAFWCRYDLSFYYAHIGFLNDTQGLVMVHRRRDAAEKKNWRGSAGGEKIPFCWKKQQWRLPQQSHSNQPEFSDENERTI